MTTLKDDLVARHQALLKQRTQREGRAVDELTQLDKQIAPLERLLAKWNKVTVDELFTELDAAGLKVTVDR